MDHQLGERCIEGVVRQRKALCAGAVQFDAWMSSLHGLDEGHRRINCSDMPIAEPADEFGGQRTGTAADIENRFVAVTPAKSANSDARGIEYLPMNRS